VMSLQVVFLIHFYKNLDVVTKITKYNCISYDSFVIPISKTNLNASWSPNGIFLDEYASISMNWN